MPVESFNPKSLATPADTNFFGRETANFLASQR
jgi:hypothetical protein